MYWSYGQVVGQYLAFRGSTAYAAQVFATSPREGGSNAGEGYVVYGGQSAESETAEKLFALQPDRRSGESACRSDRLQWCSRATN